MGTATETASQEPATWSPPALASRPAPPPLDMRLGLTAKKAAEKARRNAAQAFSPEPGMVLIDAGEFIMGDDEGGRDERPQRPVLLNAFWIDKYPVTNADYREFVDATGHRTPPHWKEGTYPPDLAEHPVTNVSWNDATAYAEWAGKRLPTEAEWEKAARGTLGQTYPWGDAFRKDYTNTSGDYGGTTPVKDFSKGASPYGVMDMCGNVIEWCADWYFDEYYKIAPADNPTGPPGGQYRAVRGGFFGESKKGVRCASRHYAPPSTMQDHIGFRCARTPTVPGQERPRSRPKPRPREVEPMAPKPLEAKPISPDDAMEAIAASRPGEVARAVRSLLIEEALPDEQRKVLQLPERPEGEGLPAIVKAAVLIVGLGPDLSADVLKYMSDSEIEQIAEAVAELEFVARRQRDEIFAEIKGRLVSGDYILQGGVDFARLTLEKALGPRKAQALLDRVTGAAVSGFHMLQKVDPSHLIPFISKEHPQTIALILSQLDSTQAAGVLNGLSEELQADVAFRMARMETLSPRVLRRLEESLAQDLQAILSGQIVEVGGPKAVAEILNQTGRSTEKSILERMDAQDAAMAEAVRNRMFTFDDIAKLTDREIQMILRDVDMKDLAIALKGAGGELQDRFFSNADEELGQKIKEEMDFSGPIRMSDVEPVQLRVLQAVRKLEEAGQVTIVRGDTSDVFV